MKRYINFILEGKIDDLRERYKDKIPTEIFDYFLSNMKKNIDGAGSVILEVMLKYYADNKDNKKYEKVELEKFIFELVRLFQKRKENLHVKDITQLKTLDSLSDVVSAKYENIKKNWSLGLYYDGEEYIIFSPLDFDTAYKYGDHDWCINREPQYFYDKNYRASAGGVVQCINKINSSKNLAIQITNLSDFWGYDRFNHITADKSTKNLEIDIWDANDESIYKGDYEDDFKPTLKEWSNDFNITAVQEIIEILDKIQQDGIDPDTYYGELYDDMWYNFNPTFEQAYDWAKKENEIYSLLEHIINNCSNEIYDFVENLFLNTNNFNETAVVDVLSTNLDHQKYLKKYNLEYTGQKIPRMIWEFIVKNIPNKDVISIIKNELLLNDYIEKMIKLKKINNSQQISLKFENNKFKDDVLDIISKMKYEEIELIVEALSQFTDLNEISYTDFVSIDPNNSFEEWQTFNSMLNN